MRQLLASTALIVCFCFAGAGMATAQDDDSEVRPGNTTWLGDTGLWFVPTGEILPDGKWSISGSRANIDRAQGLSDISHFIGTFGVGINDRVEIFGSIRADTRHARRARPLFDAGNAANGGVTHEYPNVTDFWNGDHFGDVILGGKFNITSEHRMAPAALALRAAAKFPTGNEAAGASSGASDVMVDFVASKIVGDRVELAGFGGFLFRGEPSGVTLGHGVRWGIGAGFPASDSFRLFTELHGEVPLEDNVTLTTPLTGIDGSMSALLTQITSPIDVMLGLQWRSRGGMFIGAGLTYAMQAKGAMGTTANMLGLQVRLGYHPGVRRYVAPPPPPPPPDPPVNRSPTVSASCDPCEVEPGASATVTANANDPDGDPLTYRWSAPAGMLNPTNQMATTWTAPDQDGPVPVTVTVDDGRGGSASDTATIRVVSPPAPPPREYAFEDVHFDFDRFTLRPGATRILDEAVAAMNDDPSLSLTLEGHTCNIGTSEYNQALGERRATSVRDYLTSRGIAASRLQTVTFGEERPLHDNAREETRRLNRRAAFVVRMQ